jgi:hypothetical protein
LNPNVTGVAATAAATIGSALDAAHTAAAPSTLAVTPAAADEVSVSIAHLFAHHAHDYRAQAMQAAAFQGQFAQNLKASAGACSSIAAAIASSLQSFQSLGASIGGAAAAWKDQFLHVFYSALERFFTSLPPSLLPIVLGAGSISLIAIAVVISIPTAIIEIITGQPL